MIVITGTFESWMNELFCHTGVLFLCVRQDLVVSVTSLQESHAGNETVKGSANES